MPNSDTFAQALRTIEVEIPFRGARNQTIKVPGVTSFRLVSVESTSLFFSLLARTTLPTLRTARVLVHRRRASDERDLALPAALPALQALAILDASRGYLAGGDPFVLQFICDTHYVTLLALAHPGLLDVRLAAAVWNQLDHDTVHLPNVTRLARTNDNEQGPVLSLAALTGMPRATYLDLDLYQLTLPVAAALTQIVIAKVSRARELALVPDPASAKLDALRFVSTPANAQAWSIVCAARKTQMVVWPMPP
ncbi:hypothetical protein AMAG_08457 [Allomyces macrogynus ATCC 38327]|uniref:Uncharacterized protein n=1 Tax=Allomyces macrogynus (strain ATCC 38327) TaxID=578462 RepID=A0A0L0SLJ4_ALLM3|nr:hypothetical protein AMAG_08457 [Allomyces macrogynus ATCC 38327]|eukprot:KNE63318.1 hypothetical protein AMAG_08457 [Allomyces macrogynus ATCC 38327]